MRAEALPIGVVPAAVRAEIMCRRFW